MDKLNLTDVERLILANQYQILNKLGLIMAMMYYPNN